MSRYVLKIKTMIYVQLIAFFLLNYLVSESIVPSSLLYMIDIINYLIFIYSFKHISNTIKKCKLRRCFNIWILFFIIAMIGVVLNSTNLLYVIWEYNNIFKMIIFYLNCIIFLNKKDIDNIFVLMMRIKWINFIMCLYQYFILGVSQDNLGGIFGTGTGCNAGLNVFMCIVVAYYFNGYMNNKKSLVEFTINAASSLIIASLSELKFFYIEFIIIIIIGILINKLTLKTVIVLIVSFLSINVGLDVLKNIFPDMYSSLVNIDELYKYINVNDVSVGYGISRFGMFNEVSNLFFKQSFITKLVGLGFGSCTMSSIGIFTSDFYHQYGYLNYNWFAHTMLFLQTGYLGLIVYCSFFIGLIIHTSNWKKEKDELEKIYTNFQITMLVLFIINLWYNNSSRISISYLWTICIIVVPVLTKTLKVTNISNENSKIIK